MLPALAAKIATVIATGLFAEAIRRLHHCGSIVKSMSDPASRVRSEIFPGARSQQR